MRTKPAPPIAPPPAPKARAKAEPGKVAKAKSPPPQLALALPVVPAQKTAKTKPEPVKKPAPKAAAEPVRVVPEPVLAGGGMLWKMAGRHGVAYVKDAALAGELLATEPKNLPKAAMAVYYDKKGRAFAWQVRFDTERWEDFVKRLG